MQEAQVEQVDDFSAEFCVVTPAGLLAVLPNPGGDTEGAVTAAELFAAEDLDLAPLPDDRIVAVAAGCQGLIGRMQALQLRAVEQLRARWGDDRAAASEVALALSATTGGADRVVWLARQLHARFPHLLAAMTLGELDAAKALRVVDTAAGLTDEQALQIDEQMIGRYAGRDASAIQQSVRYRVVKLDPEGAAARAERRKADRRVLLCHQDDGMSELIAYLPADVACAAYARIDAIAKSNKRRGDGLTTDQLRADVLTEMLLGKDQWAKQVRINVTVPATTLLGSSDLPGRLQGYGWIPGPIARQMATDPNSTWRRLLCDPVEGQLVEVGRRHYRPPAALDDFVRVRDQQCQVLGCPRPAEKCDVDHSHDWGKGGTTDEKLLVCLCRRHHRLKDQPGWIFEMIDGQLVITTPTSRKYRIRPPKPDQPEPEPDPKPPPGPDEPPPF